ncbi:MAG TPA: TetR/AcrR family transcriptional regulator [Solirubrobacter sp.]|nr:TetR/AcrR family transcriptional regulator [Solirubrobacter sp.]
MLKAAADIFRRKGYDATSLQDIADAVGIQKGSLYHYIDTKEDLLFAIIKDTHDRTLKGNSRWRTIEGDALARLRVFIEDHARVSMKHGRSTSIYFRDARALSRARRDEIMTARDEYESALRSLIEQAQAEGTVNPKLNPRLATFAIFGMINWLYQWYRPSGALSPDTIARSLADQALASLTAEPPPV